MSHERRRILFFAEAVTLSHVARPAFFAEALDPARYDVTFVCDPRYDALLPPLPFRVIHVESAIPTVDLIDKLTNNRPLFDLETLDAYVQEDLRIIREVEPHLIVGDMRQSLNVSATLANVPYANIINAQWSPYASIAFELPVNPFESVVATPFANLLFALAAPAGFAAHTLPANALRLKYGLPPTAPDIKHLYSLGDYSLYPDAPEIVPTRGLPATHRYLGPVMWSPSVDLPEWWDEIPDDRPVAYVNLGSSGRQALLGEILRALAALNVTVIAATAGSATAWEVPPGVFLAKYIPGLLAAKRADLVVGNGGNLSTQQALANGAPVIGIVSNLDQLVFMKAVKETGAGEFVRERDATEASFQRLAWRVLHHEPYREAAGRLAGVLASYDAAAAFRGFVDEVV